METVFVHQLPSQGSVCWFHRMIIQLLLLKVIANVVVAKTIFLNSCENCEAGTEYEVRSDFGYLVKTNLIVDSCRWDCSVRIHSPKNNSWLCLAQVGLKTQLNDSNAELFIYDNVGKHSPVIQLEYYPSTWPYGEICRKTQFIDFSLRKVNARAKLDFGKLHVQLKVLDIESTDRIYYFDGSHCSTHYALLNSQVSVYNQPGEDDPVTYGERLNPLCGLQFGMVEKNKISDKRICFLYIPSDHVDCGSNWTFLVSVAGYSLNQADIVYSLNCSHREATAWCADSGVNEVTLILQRASKVIKSTEHPKMFKFVIFDYNGTAESLMAEKASMFKGLVALPQEGTSSNITLIILIVISAVLLLAAIVLVVWKRHRLSCAQYLPVRTRKTKCDSKDEPGMGDSV